MADSVGLEAGAGSGARKARRGAGHAVLTAIGVALCVVLAPVLVVNCVLIARSYLDPEAVPSVGGVTPLIVMSDSMYPEIQKGDLVVCGAAEASALKVGDVIAFRDPEAQTDISIVTHRIVEVTEQDGQTAFLTQGDANDSQDLHPTLASDVIGTVDARVPGAGNVALFMQSTPGLAVCVLLPIVLLVAYDVVRTRVYQKRARGDAAELMAELEALRAERAAAPGDAPREG